MIKLYRSYFKLLSVVAPSLGAKKALQLFTTPFGQKTRQREIDVLKTARSENVKFEKSFIKKYTWGNGPKTALLLHGWESNAGSLGAFVSILLEQNYTVVAIDFPAHGQSGGKQTTLFKNTDAASVICAQLNHIDIAITHSFGSVVMMNALLNNPAIELEKLVMITSPNYLQKAFNEFYSLLHINAKIQSKMEHSIEKTYHITLKDYSASNMGHNLNLKKALILHDPNDQVISYKDAMEVAASLKNCEIIPFEKAGHYKILWDNRVIERVKQEL